MNLLYRMCQTVNVGTDARLAIMVKYRVLHLAELQQSLQQLRESDGTVTAYALLSSLHI